MKANQKSFVLLLAFALFGLIGYLVWQSLPAHAAEARVRKVLFYQDSMHPWVKAERPGTCTICGMDLTPIYEGEAGFGTGENVVALSSNQVTVLNVQAEAAQRRALGRRLRVAGTLEANETHKTIVSAPARGRIDALLVDYAGVEVEQGQKLITLFSPELVQLRKTLLAVRQLNRPGATNSVPDIYAGSDYYTGDILAPQSGVVVERNVYSGQYVAEGDRLLTIVDSSVLWFRFDVYQEQLPWFALGQPLEVEVSGIPGKVFPAVISFVEPTLNDATRTVKVRADIKNPVVEVNGHKQRLLKYGMYAEGRVRAEVPNVLAVPRTAILFPGGGAYAYVEKGGGAYERRSVKLGRQGDELWEVLSGIEEGDRVVTAGNVLIDAQAQFNQVSKAESAGLEEMGMAEPLAGQASSGGVPRHQVTASKGTEVPAATEPAPPAMNAPPAMAPMGTHPMARPPAGELASAKRTQRMSAIMSPGAELQLRRRATILAELQGQTATNTTRLAGTQPPTGSAAAMAGEAGQKNKPSELRMAMAEAPGQQPATAPDLVAVSLTQGQSSGTPFPSQIQYQQLEDLVIEADAISGTLAADDLERFKTHAERLPSVLAPVQKELAAPLHWEALLEPLAALSKGDAPKDLEQARSRFLPFSTGVVAFVKQLRQDLPAFPRVKIYHCPMAPKPGLWMQLQGPLRNPFFGSKMLNCGEEVKP